MAKGLLPWRALRPVLLAGAATLTWLTLSSTAATADATESGSLLGGVTSSVSSLAAPLTSTPPSLPEAAPTPPAAGTPSGLLQPAVGALAGTTDQLATAVPVVNEVIPAGAVSAVAVPVAVAADEAAAGVVEAVAPPLVESVPVLEPVIQPVSDLVTGAAPLPITLPGVADNGSVGVGVLAESPLAAPQPAADVPAVTAGEQLPGVAAASAGGSSALPVALAGTSVSTAVATPSLHPALRPAEPAMPLTGHPSPYPAPSGPSSGAGSGTSSSGPSGSAAWQNDFNLDLLLPGTFPVSGSSEHAPSPVSFDPGSSPD